MTDDILIEAKHLWKRFGDHVAVEDVSLQIRAGEVYGLMGADGAGKSTLIRLLCGVYVQDEGEVYLAGRRLASNLDIARANLGYLSQQFSLYSDLTVLENLRFFAEVRGILGDDWRQRAQETLEFVDMAEFRNRKAGALSGGMKQKLGLAAAMIHQPAILLLDEPSGGVDPVTRQAFWRLLVRLLQGGVAALLSTPYMDEAMRCNRVGFMSEGRILLEGEPQDLAKSLDGSLLRVRGEPLRAIARIAREIPSVESVQPFGDRLHLRIAIGTEREVIKDMQKAVKNEGLHLTSIRSASPDLEDVFVDLLEQ
jgi:ABC-2 type transport system ATP-binding protein